MHTFFLARTAFYLLYSPSEYVWRYQMQKNAHLSSFPGFTYEECHFCPRDCGVNRYSHRGYCSSLNKISSTKKSGAWKRTQALIIFWSKTFQ